MEADGEFPSTSMELWKGLRHKEAQSQSLVTSFSAVCSQDGTNRNQYIIKTIIFNTKYLDPKQNKTFQEKLQKKKKVFFFYSNVLLS